MVTAPTMEVSGVTKSYGAQQVLTDVSLRVFAGELVGLAGHNGAGKSTLFNVITGYTRPEAGTVRFGDEPPSRGMGERRARRRGVRIVRQELALCPALSVAESAGLLAGGAHGFRWRRKAWRQLRRILDEMFPEHRLRASDDIARLGVAQRQMLECAGAVLAGGDGLRLLILDEPTSSLDRQSAESLYAYLRAKADDGLSAIVTTHRLQEMVTHLDRVAVLRDGHLIGEQPAADGAADAIIAMMGAGGHPAEPDRAVATDAAAAGSSPCITVTDATGRTWQVARGEILGLGGLEGHGQRELLRAVFDAARGRGAHTAHQSVRTESAAAYISGDRAQAGIFRYWSVAKNLSIASVRTLSKRGLLAPRAETDLASAWRDRLGIKAGSGDGITQLSGGTQQKVLIARALATGSDILLLEDPFRGVDQATKEETYGLLRAQARQGKCVVWYSTEIEEYRQCDRLLVFREGAIVAELGADAVEDRQAVVAASFAETSQDTAPGTGQRTAAAGRRTGAGRGAP